MSAESPPQVDADSLGPIMTYRQKRRADQAELRLKYPGRKRRGPTRGLKYVRGNLKNPQRKTKIHFMDELRRVVGEKADEFITDCSKWVKEFCPLDSRTWKKMDKTAKERLYDKIVGKYDLPAIVAGADVLEALSFQCQSLFRNWRFRLKEQHYRGKTKAAAKASRPLDLDPEQWDWLVYEYWGSEKQQHISEVNTTNKGKQTIKPANGARSTARLFHELINEPPIVRTQDLDESSEPTETQEDPLYVRLYEKTKRHKDGTMDPDAEEKFVELKNLHNTEIEKNGEDLLTVQAAYMEVLKPTSGYIRGLGAGSRPPKKTATAKETSTELRVHLSTELQQFQDAAVDREAALSSQIDVLKTSNDELKASNDELKASNDSLRTSIERSNAEAIEREGKMREEFRNMLKQFRMSSDQAN